MNLSPPEMVRIPGGEFLMGKANSRPEEGPAHLVTITDFFASASPVTNAEYSAFIAATGAPPAKFVSEERFANPAQPVVGISWFEAHAYCDWLSASFRARYRLPTEAEREFAALGGLAGGDWPWEGENAAFVSRINSLEAPHAPTPGCANGFGLRCMAENVHEWCSDWYSPSYYAVSPHESPRGPLEGVRKAARGGSWRHREKSTRINARASLVPAFQYSDFGFRAYRDA